MLINFLRRYSWRQILGLTIEEYMGFVVRYLPGYEGMLLRWIFCKVTFKKIGTRSLIWPNVYTTHGHNIVAGDHLAINYGAHLDGRGGIELGNHVLIGPNVFIGSSNHVISPSSEQPRLFAGHRSAPVRIGSNVWIGANAVICPGVTIEDDAVIAAGSVVTKDVPKGSLVTGTAAFVRSRPREGRV